MRTSLPASPWHPLAAGADTPAGDATRAGTGEALGADGGRRTGDRAPSNRSVPSEGAARPETPRAGGARTSDGAAPAASTGPGGAAAGRSGRRARRAVEHAVRRLPDVVFDSTRRYRVLRAWPRGRDHALAELAAEDGTTVAAQWFADRAALEAAAARAPGPARTAGDVLLQPDGADARLRALPGVLAEDGARLVAHRPGRRAVVARTGGSAGEYVKVVRPSRAADLARRGSQVSSLIGQEVAVPRLLEASDTDRGVLRWSVVPGRTLHDLGASGGWSAAAAREAWESAGLAVALLHVAPAGAVTAQHDAAQELDAVADWLDPAVAHGLLDAELVARAGEQVTAELEARGPEPALGVLHRDLHDKQLLLDEDGGIGMIDVDTLAVGERALDVANLLVHLELRQAQGLLSAELAAAAREGFLTGLDAPEIPDARVAAYTRATRLRLAGVYAFRPRWRPVATQLLHQAARS